MNEEEVMKALGICTTDPRCCSLCPYDKESRGCTKILKKNTLSLILEKNAEIERLRAEVSVKKKLLDKCVDLEDRVRAETARKMQDRILQLFPCDKKFTTISMFTIKQIAKELEGL